MNKNIWTGLIIFLLLISGIISVLFVSKPDYHTLNIVQRVVVGSINNKWDKYQKSLPQEEQNVPEFDELMKILNPIEKNLANRIFAIKPLDLGFKGPYFGTDKPGELITIPNKKYTFREVEFESGVNYLSPEIWDDFRKMNIAMKEEIGKTVEVENAYRTPGLSAKLFLYYLEKENNWDLTENARWIAMPGYSEHNSYKNTAIDVINQDGISGQDEKQNAQDFDGLPEFKWMINNAAKFNFYLTYDKENMFGVEYEPWHWHWENKNI